MIPRFPVTVATALFMLSPATAWAEIAYTGYGKITYVENGWNGEGLAVHQSGNAIDGCLADPHDFGIDKGNSLFRELVTLATAAFTAGSDVELVVEKGDCIFGGAHQGHFHSTQAVVGFSDSQFIRLLPYGFSANRWSSLKNPAAPDRASIGSVMRRAVFASFR